MKCLTKFTMAASLVALFACNAAMTSSAKAADSIFFAFSNTDPTQTTQPAWHAISGAGASKKVYVWVSSNAGHEITPSSTGLTPTTISGTVYDVPNATAGIDLTYTAGSGSVFTLASATDYNPVQTVVGSPSPNPLAGTDINGFTRANLWDTAGTVTASGSTISGVNAIVVPTTFYNSGDTVSTANATGVSRGFWSTQANGNVNSTNPAKHGSAWLLGEVDFTTAAYGTQTLTISPFTATNSVVTGATDLTSTYSYGQITINVSFLNGDTNGDGKVDLGDVANVFNNLGTSNAIGDANHSGGVNGLDDVATVFNNVGQGNGQFAAVPEPASLALLGFGGLAMLGGLKARRRVK